MESNDSSLTNDTGDHGHFPHRYSKRARKPIQVYQPEFAQTKQKKREYSVICKILKSKKGPLKGRNINFKVTSNLTGNNLCKKFLKEIGGETPDCVFAYFSEEHQSNH